MSLTETIRSALKSNRAIIGYKKSINFLKTNSPKLIVITENMPERMRDEIEHMAKLSGVDVKVFKGSSKELGVLCGKSFPISTLVIK